jgi:cardiolipin synthase
MTRALPAGPARALRGEGLLGLWQRLLHHGRRKGLPHSEGNRVRLLRSGAEILAACHALIEGAQARIEFEIYLWKNDSTGAALLAALQAAQARGVEVRGVVDHVGSWGAIQVIRRAGLDLQVYHPIGRRLPWSDWHRRNHRKLLIADGARAITGSANWSDEYNSAVNPAFYRDLGLVLEGPVVPALEADFAASWRRAGGTPLGPSPRAAKAAPEPGWRTGVDIQIVSSLKGGGRALRRHLLVALGQLRKRGILASAYFIPGPTLLRALVRVLRRGVGLTLIMPGVTDHPVAQAASRAVYGRLLRSGAALWEHRERMFHVKAAVLDDDLVIMGSANLDSRSFRHNLELNLVLRSESLAEDVRTVLEADLAASKPITQVEWASRPVWLRALNRFAYSWWWWL